MVTDDVTVAPQNLESGLLHRSREWHILKNLFTVDLYDNTGVTCS